MKQIFKRGRDILLLALIAVVSYLVGQQTDTQALAYPDSNANQDMIAVTGEFGMGTSVLYLVDTREKTLLVYEARGGTQSNLKLVGVRDITYDLKIKSYNDVTEPSMKVDMLERHWRQHADRTRGAGRMKKSDVQPSPNPQKAASKKTERKKK